MKDIMGTLHYKDKEYPFIFNLNVMETLQEEYGSLDKWGELTDGTDGNEPNFKALLFGFREMINEALDIQNEENGTNEPMLTTKQVGRIITEVGLNKASGVLNDTIKDSVRNEKNA